MHISRVRCISAKNCSRSKGKWSLFEAVIFLRVSGASDSEQPVPFSFISSSSCPAACWAEGSCPGREFIWLLEESMKELSRDTGMRFQAKQNVTQNIWEKGLSKHAKYLEKNIIYLQHSPNTILCHLCLNINILALNKWENLEREIYRLNLFKKKKRCKVMRA